MHKDWKDTDDTIASAEPYQTRYGTEYSVAFTYKVDGEWYGGTFTTSESYRKDDVITVLYDPANPERNNLVQREKARRWIIGSLIAAVALFILYTVLH
jgi:hypothetical protein